MGWVTDVHPTTQELNACVQCGLCLPTCPTFRLTGKETHSPRGRLMAMAAVGAGVADVDGAFAEIMESCLQCRACETACPSLVPFGRAMEGARAELRAQHTHQGVRRLGLSRGLDSGPLLRLAGALAPLGAKLPLPAGIGRTAGAVRRNQPGPVKGTGRQAGEPRRGHVALLSGCVMDAWFGEVHVAAIELLTAAGFDVSVPESQGCCGALAAHDGHVEETRRMARVNVEAFEGYDRVVVDSAGCGAHLKELGHWADGGDELASRVEDVNVVIAEAIADGWLPTLEQPRGKVAVHDPCHLKHAQRITQEPRAVLRAGGYEPVDVDPVGMCCGAAGVYSVLHPAEADELGRRKVAEVASAGTTVVASANPGCEMQLRGHLGREYRVAHPVELYWEALRDSGHSVG